MDYKRQNLYIQEQPQDPPVPNFLANGKRRTYTAKAYLNVLGRPCSDSCIENGRYGHAPIRSDMSIRVYVTADTDTSTPCASVPVTYIIIPGRSGECSYFMQWVAHSIQGWTCRPLATHQLALSVSFTTGQLVETLVWLTVVITACWWGEWVRHHLSLVASTVPHGVGVTERLVSG